MSSGDDTVSISVPPRPERRSDFAKRALVDAAKAARRSNQPALLADALIETGRLERGRHRLDAARRYYEEAAGVYRTLDQPLRLAHTIRHVGDILQDADRLELAEACYLEALAIYRSHNESSSLDLANTIRGFALLQNTFGRLDGALSLWREARELYAVSGIAAGVEDCDRQIANLASGSV